MLKSKPKSKAASAVIARSRQLTDFKWTPICDVPTFLKPNIQTVLPAGEEVSGFPYSSTEEQDKFFTENISFETFLSAIANPYSKLYQAGHGAFSANNYGIVCNGLARYALGIRRRVSTARWLTIPGMRIVKPRGEYTVEEIQLCDILYAFGEGRNHVSLITDILRRDDGSIEEIEVSEAVRPLCKRASYSPELFYKKYNLFSLCRYDGLEDVPPLDEVADELLWKSGIEKSSPKISVDSGNKSNYLVGEEVLISAAADEEDTVEIYRDGKLIESFSVRKKALVPRAFEQGYYVAKLVGANENVEFCVNCAEISHEVRNGFITIHANPCDEMSKILYFDFRKDGNTVSALEKYEEISDEERRSGEMTRKIPDGAENFKVYFENSYGVWVHPMTKI